MAARGRCTNTHHREETWSRLVTVNVNNILFCLTSCYVRRCSSMFIDRDECKKHTHNASIVLFFRPQKMGGLFSLHQSVFDAIFHFNSTFALLTQKKRSRERFRCLKIDFRSSSWSVCLPWSENAGLQPCAPFWSSQPLQPGRFFCSVRQCRVLIIAG